MRIVFPLVAPGLVATAIFGFIQAWNEYIIAYVLLSSSSKQTLTVWLASFTTNHGTDWGGLMAGATLTGCPSWSSSCSCSGTSPAASPRAR